MVKAEAYGLGMAEVARALDCFPAPGGPWAFGVAAVAEGERLRASGWGGRILVFAPAPPDDYLRSAEAGLTLCLSEVAAVGRLASAAASLGRILSFHVEIDTGMGRAGLPWDAAGDWGPAILEAAGQDLLWEGTFTHFHSADEPEIEPTQLQWERFQEALRRLPSVVPAPVQHVANSAGILRFGGFGCKLARPGIYLYGGRAGPGVVPLPVASLRARLVLIRDVAAGATVGYGATYRAAGPERWGTLAIGYGDGLPRALAAAGGAVLLRGRRVPIIGRVSMDMTTVDLSDLPDAEIGDVATIFGEDGPERIEVDEVARLCGTISYEILTRLGTRLPRVYLEREPGSPGQG